MKLGHMKGLRLNLRCMIFSGSVVKVIQGQDVIFKVEYQNCSESQAKVISRSLQ